MGDAPASAPAPVVFTAPGASSRDTLFAAVAIEKAAHALDWALRGDVAHAPKRWVRVTPTSILASPDAEEALRAEGVPAPAARTLAGRVAEYRLSIAPLATPVNGPGGERPWACILAIRLDSPGVLEGELLGLLARATHTLIDRHGGFDDWIPRPADPTVRVRVPPEHPGVPLAFCPFVATRHAALDALEEGSLLGEVLEPVAAAFNESQAVQRRTPQ